MSCNSEDDKTVRYESENSVPGSDTLSGDNDASGAWGANKEINRVSRDYIPQDKPSSTANPIVVFSVMGVLIIGLVLAIVFLLRSLEGTIKKRAENGTASTTASSQKKPQPAKLSDNPADFNFSLNGIVYQLPCDYTLLAENGWSPSRYSGIRVNNMLDSKAEESFIIVNGQDELYIGVYNPDTKKRAVKDCVVHTISGYAKNSADFTVAGGITPLSSKNEVISVFGEPTDVNKYDDFDTLYYYYDQYPGGVCKCAYFTIYRGKLYAKNSEIMLTFFSE